ncbi:MAG: hypothetical protein JWQ04_2 [Pedosphaera sp.]|nr:hypothetical protein [Pedosphaera sp.]
MNRAQDTGRRRARCAFSVRVSRALMLCAMLALTLVCKAGGESPALTEYQVKALFLLNFTKYVDWPAESLPQAGSPFVIGVLGDEKFGEKVEAIVTGKTIGGQAIEVRQFAKDDVCTNCQILFISSAEKKRVVEILAKLKAAPILTVGESEQFTQQGGIINFTKKDGKVRLEIDLNAARLAKLKLSSKLLSVADSVHGKP